MEGATPCSGLPPTQQADTKGVTPAPTKTEAASLAANHFSPSSQEALLKAAIAKIEELQKEVQDLRSVPATRRSLSTALEAAKEQEKAEDDDDCQGADDASPEQDVVCTPDGIRVVWVWQREIIS